MAFNYFSQDFNHDLLNKMVHQAMLYSFANVYSLAFLSGMGICVKSPDDFLYQLKQQFTASWNCSENAHDFQLSTPMIPLRAVYSKGNPKFPAPHNAPDSPSKDMQWDKKNCKKTLSPTAQALLICNEIILARHLYARSLIDLSQASTLQEKYIGMLFLKTAIEQAKFCDHFLRNSQGFFIEKKEKAQYPHNIMLKQKKTDIDPLDQLHMMVAFAYLYDLLMDQTAHPNYYDHQHAEYFHNLATQILDQFLNWEDVIFQMKTRHLVMAIPLLIDTIRILSSKKQYDEFVVKLCAELMARKLEGGRLGSQRFSIEASSFSTHAKALKALIEGYTYTEYAHFLSEAKKVYHLLNQYWNPDMGLFDYRGRKKIKYSSKDAGYILGGLLHLANLENTQNNKALLINQIHAFFHTAFNISGLQISSPLMEDVVESRQQEPVDICSKAFVSNGTHSCVLLKEFKVYPKKNKIYIDLHKYHTIYALHAVKEMLAFWDLYGHPEDIANKPNAPHSVMMPDDDED